MREIFLFKIVFLLLNVAVSEVSTSQGEVIKTMSGKIRGIIQSSSLSGIRVQKFLNIPYAEAPVDELRFEKPRPRKPWNGTLNSTEEIIACLQSYKPNKTITEDCLILNVWTPYPRLNNATVMVWIHGGAFLEGDSGSYTGSNFVAVGDVILVTINYRLSILGFLSTGNGQIEGNLGLYDQRLAMRWVKENIASFGGNPDSITIFGESAGGASVSAHTLSKGSWPYFDRAILQSGNMLMPWSIMTESQIKVGEKWLRKEVNCNNDKHFLKCLQNVTVDKWKYILNIKQLNIFNISFAPTVDGEFISNHPQKLLENGEVKRENIILGITRDEMYAVEAEIFKRSRNVSDYLKSFEKKLKSHFKNASKDVYEKARGLYIPKCIPSYIEALKPSVAFESDRMFICAARQEVNLRSKSLNTTNVYLYQYSFAPLINNYYPEFYKYGSLGFAGHAIDILSVFGQPINDKKFPNEDQTLSMRMILYWTNFAKTGNPNSGTRKLPLVLDNVLTLPTWPPHSRSEQEFLDMGSLSQMVVGNKLREKTCDFLMDPEGFIEREVTSGSTRNFLTLQVWSVIVGIYVLLLEISFASECNVLY